MDSLERAREALTRIAELTPGKANAMTAFGLHYSVKAIAETALAALSRPVEGVKGEPRVKPLEWDPVRGEGVETYQATCAIGIYRVFTDEDSAAGAVFAEFAVDVSRFCMLGFLHHFYYQTLERQP